MKKNQMSKISMFALLIAACSVGSMHSMRRVTGKAMPKIGISTRNYVHESEMKNIKSRLKMLGGMGTLIGLMSGYFAAKFSIYNQENSIERLQQRIIFLNQKLTEMQNASIANVAEELKELQERLAKEQTAQKAWNALKEQNVKSSQISANPLDTSLPAAMEQDTANQPAGVESEPKSE